MPPPRTVLAWLQSVKLEACYASLAELGYDEDVDMIIDEEEEEVPAMVAAVEAAEGIKRPTVNKFKRELKKLRGGQ